MLMAESGQVRLMIVDDEVLFRRGIVASLSAFEDITVIAEADSGEDLLLACQETMPDVALINLVLPGVGGIEAIEMLHSIAPDTQVIAMSSMREGPLVEEALRAGAISYLHKNMTPEQLAATVRLASQGMPVFASGAMRFLMDALAKWHSTLGYDLTEREREVLALITEGHSNHAIAERLVVTPATVKFHARSIRQKLGATSRIETAVIALKNHLIQAS